jgi:hypothetical protein
MILIKKVLREASVNFDENLTAHQQHQQPQPQLMYPGGIQPAHLLIHPQQPNENGPLPANHFNPSNQNSPQHSLQISPRVRNDEARL